MGLERSLKRLAEQKPAEPWWQKYQVSVPEGVCGSWAVQRFKVGETEARAAHLQDLFFGVGGRSVPAGTYTRLTCRGRGVVMSDTPAEILDHWGLFQKASGRVLMFGLGLGMSTLMLARKSEVTAITVVELEQDVIDLVGPHVLEHGAGKVTIVQGDAFSWKPPKGEKYDLAWFDIWDGICMDNCPGMGRLKKRFCRVAPVRMCWEEQECRRQARAYHRDTGVWPWAEGYTPRHTDALGGDPLQELTKGEDNAT